MQDFQEKEEIKSIILQAVIQVTGQDKLQKMYEKVFEIIADHDFPDKWT